MSGNYIDYFSMNVDTESLTFLTMANDMLHSNYSPFIITIAEVRIGRRGGERRGEERRGEI